MSGRIHKDFIKAFMEYSSFSQSPEKFLHWSALSIVAAALERKVWLSNGATTFYPNLYVMLIGEAGTRKSSSAHMAVDLLRQAKCVNFMATRLNEASFMHALMLAGNTKKFNWQGEEYKHSASFLYASEAATTFQQMYTGGGLVIPLTDVFNCEPLGWSNSAGWDKHTMKDGLVKIFNPCVNLLACSTPTWFTTSVMSRQDAEAGFGSRLLLVVQKGRPERDFGWNETDAKNHKLKLELISDLQHINKLKGPFTVDASFKKYYAVLDHKLHVHMEKDVVSNLMRGYYERKLTHTTKLAMVLSASRSDELILTEHELWDAWNLVETLEANMTQAYAALGGENTAQVNLYNQVTKYLVSNEITRFTKSSLLAKFKNQYPIRDVSRVLDQMLQIGQLKYVISGAVQDMTLEVVSSSELNRLSE